MRLDVNGEPAPEQNAIRSTACQISIYPNEIVGKTPCIPAKPFPVQQRRKNFFFARESAVVGSHPIDGAAWSD
jgi:hypothetical protein